MFLQETYELTDCLWYDEATSNAKASQYANNTLTPSYSNNGTTISANETSGSKFYNTAINGSTTWRDTSKNYQVEVDFSFTRDSTSSSCSIGIGSAAVGLHNLFSGANTGSGTLKIVTNGSSFNIWLDGTAKSGTYNMTTQNGVYFQIYRTGSITFKNLKILEI